MKNFITLALLLTIISLSSCKKKTTAPETTTTTTTTAPSTETINIQYRVTSTSGHFNVEYTSLDEDANIITTSTEVKKMTFSYSFNWKTKQKLSIKAFNTTPSEKEVVVEIYVDGVLFKSASANAANASALAEGVYTK